MEIKNARIIHIINYCAYVCRSMHADCYIKMPQVASHYVYKLHLINRLVASHLPISRLHLSIKNRKLKKDLPTSLYHPETPLFTGNSKREAFLKHLTQHLTQQVTF